MLFGSCIPEISKTFSGFQAGGIADRRVSFTGSSMDFRLVCSENIVTADDGKPKSVYVFPKSKVNSAGTIHKIPSG